MKTRQLQYLMSWLCVVCALCCARKKKLIWNADEIWNKKTKLPYVLSVTENSNLFAVFFYHPLSLTFFRLLRPFYSENPIWKLDITLIDINGKPRILLRHCFATGTQCTWKVLKNSNPHPCSKMCLAYCTKTFNFCCTHSRNGHNTSVGCW